MGVVITMQFQHVIATPFMTDFNPKSYCMEGNFGGGNVVEFGESSVICQTKTIQISTYH